MGIRAAEDERCRRPLNPVPDTALPGAEGARASVKRAAEVASLLALALLPLTGCEGLAGGSQVTSVVDAEYPPKPEDCPIVVFRSGEPGGAYTVVARLTARIEGPPPPGGDVGAVLGEMKREACRAGADAIGWLAARRSAQPPRALVSAVAVRFASLP